MGYLSRRKEIFNFYIEKLNNIPELTIVDNSLYNFDFTSSYYFFWVQTNKRNELANFLKDNGVYTTFRYFPLHKIKLFSQGDEILPYSDYIK